MTPPSRRDRTRPAELLAISGGIGLFVGLVVFISTRDLVFSLIALGITFILSIMTIAMLALSSKPGGEEQREIDESDTPDPGPRGH